jgi:hypothetical protein
VRRFRPRLPQKIAGAGKGYDRHGLNPSNFVIGKHEAQSPRLTIALSPAGQPFEYTVFVKDRSFTVTQPDDLGFLTYFWRLCFPPTEAKDDPNSIGHKLHSAEKKNGNIDRPAGDLAQQADLATPSIAQHNGFIPY